MRSLDPDDRETTITMNDGCRRATVYSEQRTMITKVRNLAARYPDAVEITRQGKHGQSAYIEADMPAAFVGLRPAKFPEDAANGNASPSRALIGTLLD